MGGMLTGILGGVTSLFKGADKPIRDKQTGKDKNPFESYPQWDTPEKRIKWLLDKFYWEVQLEKIQMHRKWFARHLFYTGYHDNILSDTGYSFESVGVNQAEYSFASNDYRAYIRAGAAMYVKSAPEFIAQPTSDDPDSQGVAEAARATLEVEKENIGYDAIRAMEATNLRIYGNSFRYCYLW